MTGEVTPGAAGAGPEGRGTAELLVRPLTHELLDDWLAFFDGDAFSDNPDWSDCYCQWFHVDGDDAWQARTGKQNRTASIEMIRARRMHGYLAYLDGRTVGWCQAAPRSQLPRIVNDPDLALGDDSGVGSIVCFLIAASARRQGVARRLLEAACAGFRHQGYTIAEAYPKAVATGDAATYHGPLELYLGAGFREVGRAGDFVVVRRDLGGEVP